MSVHIAHPQPTGKRRRKPVIHSDAASEIGPTASIGPTALQRAISEVNARNARKRAPRKTANSDMASGSVGILDTLDRRITEAELAGKIVEYARECGGWLIDCKRQGLDATHIPSGVGRDDWREIGDGLPDLILIHETRALLVLWEQKKAIKPSALREKQVTWGSALRVIAAMYPNVVYAVISPDDWPYIKAILRGH